jgi:hypothetical protein
MMNEVIHTYYTPCMCFDIRKTTCTLHFPGKVYMLSIICAYIHNMDAYAVNTFPRYDMFIR